LLFRRGFVVPQLERRIYEGTIRKSAILDVEREDVCALFVVDSIVWLHDCSINLDPFCCIRGNIVVVSRGSQQRIVLRVDVPGVDGDRDVLEYVPTNLQCLL
jgi:hypothetical protein